MGTAQKVKDILKSVTKKDDKGSAQNLQIYRIMKIVDIKIDKRNREATEEDVKNIASSMKIVGQIVPVLITPKNDLIDGERRLRGLLLNGETDIKVLIQKENSNIVKLSANYFRENFSVEYIQKLFKKELRRDGMNQKKLASTYGVTPGRVSQIMSYEKKKPVKKPEPKVEKPKKEEQKPKKEVKKGSVTLRPVEGVKLVIDEMKVLATFTLTNANLKSPVKFIETLAHEVNWAGTIREARE